MSCGHTGQEGCLGGTCCHMTITQTCSLANVSSCCVNMETPHGSRLGKGIGELWGNGDKLS